VSSQGPDFERVAGRVSAIFDLENDSITVSRRQWKKVWDRDLLSYWCALESGIPGSDLSKRLYMTPVTVNYAVKRAEKIAQEAVVIWMIELFECLRLVL
jgi:hypothetical protein